MENIQLIKNNSNNFSNNKENKSITSSIFIILIILIIFLTTIFFIFYSKKENCEEKLTQRYQGSRIRFLIERYKVAGAVKNSDDLTNRKIDDQCFDFLKNKSNLEFIDLVRNYRILNSEIASIDKEKWIGAVKLVNDYFQCNLKQENWKSWGEDGGFSEEVKLSIDYISSLDIPESNKIFYKKSLLVAINDAMSTRYLTNLAFGDLNMLCPETLDKMCFDATAFENPNLERVLNYNCENRTKCDYMCEEFLETEKGNDTYLNNAKNLLERNVDCSMTPHEISWLPKVKTIENIEPTHIAFLYRYGGENLALSICDNLVEPNEKSECKLYVDGVLKLLNSYKIDCDEYLEKAKNTICVL